MPSSGLRILPTLSTTRREFLRQGAAAAALGLAPGLSTGCGSDLPAERKRPNVLVVLTDQQAAWTVGAHGGKEAHTPHADALAREGIVCEKFLANSAVCTPARGVWLTGLYPHVNGAFANERPLRPDVATFATVMRDAGYRTGWAGKWHLDGVGKPGWVPRERAFGFDDSRFMWNRGHWKTVVGPAAAAEHPRVDMRIGDEHTYTTDWLVDRTTDFLRDAARADAPFLFVVSIPDPHPPYATRMPYSARFRPEDVRIPSTLFEENQPPWLANYTARVDRSSGATTREAMEQWLRVQKAQYLGMIELVDDALGRILGELEALGAARETIVVFTSDHGEYMGEHGLMGKGALYEPASHVPLIIRFPEGLRAGRRVPNLIAGVDFAPTLLSLCGLAPPDGVQGRDATPLLRGTRVRWEEEVHLHHATLKRAGIFTDRYQLMLVEEGGHMLFSRTDDPEQAHNLFADPGHARVVQELLRRVVEHNRRVQSPAAPWLAAIRPA